jgi:hypothetical protein
VEIIRTRTARGRGRWGHDEYEVDLVTSVQTWRDTAGTARRSVTTFELACSAPAGSRFFATEAERAAFSAASFAELVLDPVEPPASWSEASSLHAVVGLPVTGVELVADYARLLWPEDALGIYSRSAVMHGGHRWDDDDPGYAEALRSVTGRVLTGVDELLDRGLVLVFEGGTEVEISLREAPGRVIEAAEHGSSDDSRGRLWFVGQPPFDG